MKISKILCMCAALFMCACTPKTASSTTSDKQAEDDYHTYVVDGQEYTYNSHLMNFLITGVDNYDTEEKGQADFILLLSFDRENHNYRVLQLDRNSMVDIKMFDLEGNFLGWDKNYLCLAYRNGTGEKQSTLYMKDAVSRLLHNIPINYYLTMSLSDLPSIQNVVGDMDVTVVDDLLVNVDPSWTMGTTITITADNVERYIRYRDITVDGSNEMRMARHREYLTTYLNKLKGLASGDFNSVLTRVSSIAESMYSNIQVSEISDILDMVMNYEFDDIHTLQGEVVQGEVRDEFEIDYDVLPQEIVDLYYVKK
ncbi:MAG: LCP family protein [Bulleidia sp.]